MQEVLLGTDRLPARRMKALAGGVLGFITGVTIASAAGWTVLQEERFNAAANAARIREEVATAITTARADILAKQAKISNGPIRNVAALNEQNSTAILAAMAKFPTFKTEPYKQLFADLTGLVRKQQDQSIYLIQALRDPSLANAMACTVAQGNASVSPLWSTESLSLSGDGWRGVQP